MSKKPGAMIYHDILPVLEHLSDEQAGILFRAIMTYSSTHVESPLPEPLLALWPLIASRLNADENRYEQVAQKRKYAAYTRWAQQNGVEPQPYNLWMSEMDGCDSAFSDAQ